MAENSFQTIDYVGFQELEIYDRYFKNYLNAELSRTIRTVKFDPASKTVSFYNEPVVTGGSPAQFVLVKMVAATGQVEVPEGAKMKIVAGDTEGVYKVGALVGDSSTTPVVFTFNATDQTEAVQTALAADPDTLTGTIGYVYVVPKDGKSDLYCYTSKPENLPEIPVFSMTLPETDLSALMKKISGGTVGNVPIIGDGGQVIDGGVKLSDMATKQDVATAAAGHITKERVTQTQIDAMVADPTLAEPNKIYLLKDEEASGEDIYKEYTMLGDEFACIGSTTVSLEGLATQDALNGVDTKVTKNATDIAALDARVQTIENGFVPVTEEQIASLFTESGSNS